MKHRVKAKERPLVAPCKHCGKTFESKYAAKRHICKFASGNPFAEAFKKAGYNGN